MKSVYADLEEFFVWKLGVQNAPIEVLVGELIMFTAGYASVPVTEDTVKAIEEMLVTISMYISYKPAWQFCLLSLVDRAVFPVHIKGQIRLQRYEQFYISEKGGKSNERFRESVPILAFSSAQTLSLIRPMFESTVWPHLPRILEASLIAKSIPLGPKILDHEATDLYSNRAEYMEKYDSRVPRPASWRLTLSLFPRYVQHLTQYNPTPRQMEFLAKMRKTSIYVVDTIIIMWNLDGKTVNVQSDVKVSIDEAEEQVTLYVSSACAAMLRTRDREICSLLGDRDRVAIDKLALLQFVSMPWEDLLLYLEDEGVDVSTCIPQTTQESACVPEVSTPVSDGEQIDEPALPPPSLAVLPQAPVDPPPVRLEEQNRPVSNGASPVMRLRPDAPAFNPPPSGQSVLSEAQPLAVDETPHVRRPAMLNGGKHRRRRSSTIDLISTRLPDTMPAATPTMIAPPVSPPQGIGQRDDFDGVDPRSSRSEDRDPANGVLGELYVSMGPRNPSTAHMHMPRFSVCYNTS